MLHVSQKNTKREINNTERFKYVSKLFAFLVIAFSVFMMFIWIFDGDILAKVALPKMNALIAFVLYGVAVLLMNSYSGKKNIKNISIALIAMVIAIGAFTLFQYIFSVNFGIDELFVKDTYNVAEFPGRIVPLSATLFVFLGINFIFKLLSKKKISYISDIIMVIFFPAVYFAILVELFKTNESGILAEYILMPLPAAILFVLSNLSNAFYESKNGIMSVIFGKTFTGKLLRKVILFMFFFPNAVGVFHLIRADWTWFNQSTGVALDTTISLCFLIILIFLFGYYLVSYEKKSIAHEEEEKINYRRLQSIISITEKNASSMDELISFSVDEIVKLSNSRIGYIYQYDSKKEEFLLNAYSTSVMDECKISFNKSYWLQNTGIWGEVVRQRKPIIINNYEAHNPLKKGMPKGHAPLQKFMSIPLIIDGDIVAAVGVANKEEDYTETDVRQLTMLMESVWLITERRMAEMELQKYRLHLEELVEAKTSALKFSEEQLRVTFNSIGDAIIATDNKGNITRMNAVAERMTGWKTDEVVGKPSDLVFCIYNSITTEPAINPVNSVLETKEPHILANHTVLITKEGKEIHIADAAAPIFNEKNDILGVVLNFRDVSVEYELREEMKRVQFAVDNAVEEIYFYDYDGKIIYVNNAAYKKWGYGEQTIKLDIFDLVENYSMDIWHHYWKELKEKGYDIRRGKHKTKDGVIYPVETISNIISSYGKEYLCVFARDLTQELIVEEEREKARIAAEAANRAKSAFLANMSHEIRTPMNAILGYTQILQRDKKLSKEQSKYISIIGNSGQHLLRVINDVLEMSKIEAGKIEVSDTTFNILDIVREIENMFRLSIEEKGISLIVEIDKAIHKFIKTDGGKLRQIVINLLGNAYKFTSSGEIVIRVNCEAKEEKIKYYIEVADTGKGIAKEQLEKIFEAFHQIDGEKSQVGGTGLGLTISRQYAKMMGGDITVSSVLDKGSTFIFTFEAIPVSASSYKDGRETKKKVIGLEGGSVNPRILVVDDRFTNRDLIKRILGIAGFTTFEAENGVEAIESFKKYKPDIIFIDRRMPLMGGIEAVKKIRELPNGYNIPIVLITASVMAEDQKDLEMIKLEGIIKKPFSEEDIFGALSRLFDIQYIYEEKDENDLLAVELEEEIHLEEKIRKALIDACEDGDIKRIEEILEEKISVSYPKLNSHISELLEYYDYEEIINIIKGE